MRVIKPEHSGSMFYNYKDFFPVVLMAVETLTTALCTLVLVVTETVVLQFLKDVRCGYHLDKYAGITQ